MSFIYLFIYLFLAVLGVSCSTLDLFVVAHALFVAMHGLLSSCGAWAPECMGSVVVAHGLSSCGMHAQ